MNYTVSQEKGFAYRDVSWGSKEWANQELRYAIHVLKGYGIDSAPSGRVAIALYLRDLLEASGWPWQARTLEYWIHLFQREFKDLEARDLHGERVLPSRIQEARAR